MLIFKWFRFCFLFVIILGCGKTIPSLENFDTDQWKSDPLACLNKRSEMVSSLIEQKSKLLALDEIEIVEVLGKPDQHELYKRNQKFYYYYIEPAGSCDTSKASSQQLVIRFNAVGLAKEIGIE